jgi:long-chain acyl-CoA synthetase
MPAVGELDAANRTNVAHIIDAHPDDAVALLSGNRRTTYGELRDHVARLRGGLIGAGIAAGDRVALVSGNNRFFVVSYLAAVGMGAIVVPLNPASPPTEIGRELLAVEPVAVMVGPGLGGVWSAVEIGALASITTVVTADAGAVPGAIAYADAIAGDPSATADVPPEHLAVLMFTSGTAGPPKAAMLTHANLLANIEQSLSVHDRTRADDVVYGVLPLFHIFGLNVVLGTSLREGASIVLVQRFDPAAAVETFAQRGVTVVPGAPPLWTALADFDEVPAESLASVRLALSGAARLSPRVAERCQQRFGVTIREGYGLTEASPVVTSSAGMAVRPGSVGRALVGVEVRLVDGDGDDVPVGDAGEVLVRGDNVFVGYWNEPEATARVLAGGWLRTGDVATVDDDGYLYLVDRAKDLIIVSGFNVFPGEVEEVIATHPDVADVAVVGVPHPHHGEAVRAYVVRAADSELDEDTVIEHCGRLLARYKCPSKVLFVDQLPKNANGKLLRRELKGTVLDT